MKIAPRHVRAAYELFRALPPYDRWRLPKPHKVRFSVYANGREYGRYEYDGRHHIKISRRNVRSFHALAITMAHELIHLRQQLAGTDSDESQHNREFVKLAKQACRALGFESAGFV